VSGSAKRHHNSYPLTLQTVYALSANSLQHLGPRIRESRTLSRTVILYNLYVLGCFFIVPIGILRRWLSGIWHATRWWIFTCRQLCN